MLPLKVNTGTFYKKGRKKFRNYTQALTTCTKDPEKNLRNAIGSSSFSSATNPKLDAGNLDIAGDYATWDGKAAARCN